MRRRISQRQLLLAKKREVTAPRGKFIGQFMTKTKGEFGEQIFKSFVDQDRTEFMNYWNQLGKKLMRGFPAVSNIMEEEEEEVISDVELAFIDKHQLVADAEVLASRPGSVRQIRNYFKKYSNEFKEIKPFRDYRGRPSVLVYLRELNEFKYNKFRKDLEEMDFTVADYDKGDPVILIYL